MDVNSPEHVFDRKTLKIILDSQSSLPPDDDGLRDDILTCFANISPSFSELMCVSGWNRAFAAGSTKNDLFTEMLSHCGSLALDTDSLWASW